MATDVWHVCASLYCSGATSWARLVRWRFLFLFMAVNTSTSSPKLSRSPFHPTHQVSHITYRKIRLYLMLTQHLKKKSIPLILTSLIITCYMKIQFGKHIQAQERWSNRACVLSPVVIDMDGRIYIRQWQGGLLSGGFEKNPKPIFTEGRNQLEIQNMQEDWDHFGNGGRLFRI